MPWRQAPGAADPYRVWVSEVMLQQTRVATATPYYRRFLSRWPTLESLARAREEDVLAAFSGLGYYARGRNLLRAARLALASHGGLPASYPALLELPGFGPYTAGAVASIAFGIPEAAVDGNAARVLARLFGLGGPLSASDRRRRLQALARGLLTPERPGDLNQSVMELGATLCLPRGPRCGRCPLARWCRAFRSGRTGSIPPPRPKRKPATLRLALARVERGSRLLLWRRPAPGLFGGLWQLPGVEVAEVAGERGARLRLRNALWTRLGLRCRVGRGGAEVLRALTHRRLVLQVFRCDLTAGSGLRVGADLRWAGPEERTRLSLPTAMRRAIEASAGGPGRGARPGRARLRPRAGGGGARGP